MTEQAKAYPIISIMERCGLGSGKKRGNRVFYSSPFSSDSDPSFCIFVEDNRYFDFSNGDGGDSINLYMKLKGCSFKDAIRELSGDVSFDSIEAFVINKSKPKKNKKDIEPFDKNKFLIANEEEINEIKKYAESRNIRDGYYPSKVFDTSFIKEPMKLALMFVHNNGEIDTGAKFRFISPEKSRFTSRGILTSYILENMIPNHFSSKRIYVCESETSANSLWMICRELSLNAIIISMGGVSSQIEIPTKYKDIENKFLILDYDGDEEKYLKRVDFHKNFDGKSLKIMLDKGSDLNSIYSDGSYKHYLNLINV